MGATTAFATDGANVRISTFDTETGQGYFAASIKPVADSTLQQASESQPADVVVIVDTSASQVGQFRTGSLAALEAIVDSLRPGDRIRIYAADVRSTDMSKSFGPASSTKLALQRLRKRLPLGNTNLSTAIGTVRTDLATEPQNRTRSVIYIGDGSSIDGLNNPVRFGALVDALRADHIAVHSIAIGPATELGMMAILANHTGGTVGIVGNTPENMPAAIAGRVGKSALMSPIWLDSATLLSGMEMVQSDRLPPLRLDRDSILMGSFAGHLSEGSLELSGQTTASKVKIVADAKVSESNDFFGFLPGLVRRAQHNDGLMLPTAGTRMLEETARVLAMHSDSLVQAGQLALQQGNKKGAKVVAQRALEADPTNPQAQTLERISANRLVVQNPQGSLDDIFGAAADDPKDGSTKTDDPFATDDTDPFGDEPAGAKPATPAPAADDPFKTPPASAEPGDENVNPFGGATAKPAAPADTEKPAAPADAGDNPFGGEPAKPADPSDNPFGGDPAPATPDPATPDPATPDPAPAEPATPAPAAGGGNNIFSDDNPFGGGAAAKPATPTPKPSTPAPAPAIDSGSLFGNMPVGDDELKEETGDLLNRVRAERAAAEGRLRAEVRAKLREANRRLRTDPIGVSGGLKSLLANIEAAPDVNPEVRVELSSQVRASIEVASRLEAGYMEGQRNLEQVQQGATAQEQLLAATFRREDELKVLSQQMNALIAEGRYEEADGEVTLEFAKIAGDSIIRDSASGRHFTEFPLSLQTFARANRYREMRWRNFVDAFSLVMKANIPFVDEPPVQFPDSDWWQRMSRRRLEKYGAIELVGDNETERRIQSALGDETSQSFIELPLSEAITQISEAHDIPIVIDNQALEDIGLSAEEPVTITLKNVTLRSFLRIMLRDLDLTYVIKDEVMQITSQEAAEENLVTKVYPV
ncbi:VWA domain-containing protein, partial [bacterium]|nr:VWA domain-containing protein [bacterium]